MIQQHPINGFSNPNKSKKRTAESDDERANSFNQQETKKMSNNLSQSSLQFGEDEQSTSTTSENKYGDNKENLLIENVNPNKWGFPGMQ